MNHRFFLIFRSFLQKKMMPLIFIMLMGQSFYSFGQMVADFGPEQNQEIDETKLLENLNQAEKEQLFRLQEETLDGVRQATQMILSCLQQLEMVLHENKIKLYDALVSKQVVQEISDIKDFIEQKIITEYIAMSPVEGTAQGLFFNKIMMDYFIGHIENNTIDQITLEKFLQFISQIYDSESSWMQKNKLTTIETLIEDNTTSLRRLELATDNVGLSPLNKAFRYLEDIKVPLFGTSLLNAIKWVTVAGSVALAVYVTFIYTAPQDFSIKNIFTGKEFFNVENLPGRAFIGNLGRSTQYMHSSLSDEQRVIIGPHLGLVGNLDVMARPFGPTAAGLLGGYVAMNAKPMYDSLGNQSAKTFDNILNYLRGNNSKTTNLGEMQDSSQKVYFKDMIGSQYLEEKAQIIADFVMHPQRYISQGTAPATGILLTGASRTGKSYFAQAIQTLVNEKSKETNQECKFWYITPSTIKMLDLRDEKGASLGGGLTRIFQSARAEAPIILFFDEIDSFGFNRNIDRDLNYEMLTLMSGLESNSNKPVIVIGATNTPEKLDKALLQGGRFGDIIQFERPSYQYRKEYLEKALKKNNIKSLSADDIDIIAQETDGCAFETLKELIATSLRQARLKGHLVRKSDFEEALDSQLRHIRLNNVMSHDEKQIVATYQAGQAAARFILGTDQQVIKITINDIEKAPAHKEGFDLEKSSHKEVTENSEYLVKEQVSPLKHGHVFTLSKHSQRNLLNDKQQQDELMALLAGQAALELMMGATFNEFCKEDRATILYRLEQKISQGSAVTETIRQKALAEKDVLYAKVKTLLQSHIVFIKRIVDQLIANNTINKYEWELLVQGTSTKNLQKPVADTHLNRV